MRRSSELALIFILFCILEILFFYPALLPGQTFFLRDLSGEIIPKRFFWANSSGIPLWTPYGFFGEPYAANPQSEAFYPFNFWFLIFGAERGIVFYIVFHHLVFLFPLYLALRELGYGIESSLFSSLGFGFGGFFSSLMLLPVLLSTVAWLPLVIILLSRASQKKWFQSGLILAPVIALQLLAGELELAAMSWALAILAAALSPGNAAGFRVLARCLSALALALFLAAALSAFQLALTLEMIPLSNRAGGFDLENALAWSLWPYQLKSIFIPNYILPPSSFTRSYGMYWGLGFFNDFPYLLSQYLGIAVALLAGFGFSGPAKRRSLGWLLVAVFALLMSMGEHIPLYQFFFHHLPGFNLVRFPIKFYFLFTFALVMLAASGCEALGRWTLPRLSLALLASGIGPALVVIFLPLRSQLSSTQYAVIESHLFLISAAKTLSFLLVSAGLFFLASDKNRFRVGMTLAMLVYCDLFLAHRWLNPPITTGFYRPTGFVRVFLDQSRERKFPARTLSLAKSEESWQITRLTNPLEKYTEIKSQLEGFWPFFYRIQGIRSFSSVYISDIRTFISRLDNAGMENKKLILTRASVQYVFYRDRGFVPLSLPFPRAMVFYRAAAVGDRAELINLWSEPNFPALEILLVESAGSERWRAPRLIMSEAANIVSYDNDQVVIEAEAKADAWLVLLDSYYPGWRATVDGNLAEIYRANGFFRAVRIPAGKHTVSFEYNPQVFYLGLKLSAAGFLVWLGLLIFSFRIDRGKR